MHRRNIRFDAAFKLRFHPLGTLASVKSDALNEVIEAYRANCLRLDPLLRMGPVLIQRAMKMQYCSDKAFVDLLGRMPLPGDPEYDTTPGLDERSAQIWQEVTRREMTVPNYADIALRFGHENVSNFALTEPVVWEGTSLILSSCILTTWTAIEALCGDLWEAALNQAPAKFTALNGQHRRIEKLAFASARSQSAKGKSQKQQEPEPFSIPLNVIASATNQTFDLGKKLGTILRGEFKFQTLSGIRSAYSRAFENAPRVDRALAHNGLDSLSSVRNLLVHKGGVADEEYKKRCASFPKIPKPNRDPNLPIAISGNTVSSLINPVISCGCRLIMAVDAQLK